MSSFSAKSPSFHSSYTYLLLSLPTNITPLSCYSAGRRVGYRFSLRVAAQDPSPPFPPETAVRFVLSRTWSLLTGHAPSHSSATKDGSWEIEDSALPPAQRSFEALAFLAGEIAGSLAALGVPAVVTPTRDSGPVPMFRVAVGKEGLPEL